MHQTEAQLAAAGIWNMPYLYELYELNLNSEPKPEVQLGVSA